MTSNTLDVLINRYLKEIKDLGYSQRSTVRHAYYVLSDFSDSFGCRPLNHLNGAEIKRWMTASDHLAASTRRNYLSCVRSFARWLVESGRVTKDPTSGIKPPRQSRSVPRAMRTSSIAQLLAYLPDDRSRLMFWLMVGLGLRCCEVANLELSDYDEKAQVLRIVGKGGHERILPVTIEVRSAIAAYLGVRGMVSGPFLQKYSRQKGGLSAGTISQCMSKWMTEAGVKTARGDGVSAHALRHTAASDVLDQCHDLRVVQQMLGHVSLTTTSIYLRRACLDDMRNAMEGRPYRPDAA